MSGPVLIQGAMEVETDWLPPGAPGGLFLGRVPILEGRLPGAGLDREPDGDRHYIRRGGHSGGH